jgi:integrase
VSITPADIQTLVNAWTERRAPTTVVRNYATVRAIFRFAVNNDWILRSPCRGIRLSHANPRVAQILTADQLGTLASAMGDYGLMAYLAVITPFRWGEIAGLRVGRLDFLRKTITLARQRTRGIGGCMVDQDPKSRAGQRTLAVPDWLMIMLTDHLAVRGITGAQGDAHVFVGRGGGPLDYEDWRKRVWLPAVKAVGLVDLHFHDLRKTAATALVASGTDVKTAQVRLGHASPQMTLRVYAQADEGADRAAANRIGELFRPRDGRAMDQIQAKKKRPGKGA